MTGEEPGTGILECACGHPLRRNRGRILYVETKLSLAENKSANIGFRRLLDKPQPDPWPAMGVTANHVTSRTRGIL